MFRKVFCFIMVMCMFTFVGCKNEVETEVNLSDLVKVGMDQSKIEYAETSVTFSVPSKNDFEMKKEYFKKLVSKCFDANVNNFRFKKEGMDSLVKFETSIPILKNRFLDEYLFSLVYTEEDTVLCLNQEMFKTLNTEIKNKFFTTLNIQDIDFNIKFINDTDMGVEMTCYANYINGEPKVYMTKQSVEDSITFDLSDMSKDMMLYNQLAYLFEN